MGRQFDECGEEVLAFLHVFLHFLSEQTDREKPASREHSPFKNHRKPTCDTTVTLAAGEAVGGGVDATLPGLGTGVPPVVITVEFFCGVVIFTDTAAPPGATGRAFREKTGREPPSHVFFFCTSESCCSVYILPQGGCCTATSAARLRQLHIWFPTCSPRPRRGDATDLRWRLSKFYFNKDKIISDELEKSV